MHQIGHSDLITYKYKQLYLSLTSKDDHISHEVWKERTLLSPKHNSNKLTFFTTRLAQPSQPDTLHNHLNDDCRKANRVPILQKNQNDKPPPKSFIWSNEACLDG